jgi:serine/threonine protein kinase
MVVRASDNGPQRRPQRWTLHSIPIDESVVAAAPQAPDPGPDLEAEIGARILGGRYVLLELLSHGELGGVYLGRDRVQNRSIEVKLLSPGAAESAATVSYLRSRARRMFGIRHAHVASVYDEALDEDNLPFFVSEHIEGRNLHHMQGDARLTGAAVQAIALQLAEGLAALHGRSVVHGAVTPGNVVWIEDDTRPVQIKLVDREVSPGNTDAHGYRNPAALDQRPDEAADLYALGAVVYELCTGRLPSAEPGGPRMRGDDLPITVTEAFETILLDLLQPDPNARAAGARALCERLTTIVGPPPPRPALPRSEQPIPSGDGFAAFADEWLETNPADAELTRFRPVEDGPAPATAPATTPATAPATAPATPDPEEPVGLTSAEYTELGSGELSELSASALAAPSSAAPASITASITASSISLASSSSALTAAIASSSAALTGPAPPHPAHPAHPPAHDPGPAPQLDPRSFVVSETRAPLPVTPEPTSSFESLTRPPRVPWRRVATVVIVALILIVLWQLLRAKPASDAVDTTPIATPQTTASAAVPPRPVETTLARTHEASPLQASEPDPAPAVSAAATAEPQPAGTTDLPEQLSAGEFRKVLLRANRLASTRTCYRKHTTGPDRSVELIAVVAPEGRVQKLKIDRGPLGDCLRKIVNGLEFSAAQKSAQHNFVFHHPDVSQSG